MTQRSRVLLYREPKHGFQGGCKEGREDGESSELLNAPEVIHVISTPNLLARSNNTAQPDCKEATEYRGANAECQNIC